MTRRWKVSLPKEQPLDGKGHFVFAFKDAGKGARIELSGQVDRAELLRTLGRLTEAMRPTAYGTSHQEGVNLATQGREG